MPILNTRHTEKRSDGKPIFIIKPPNQKFSGVRAGVTILHGMGRTTKARRAQILSELFGYAVQLPVGFEAWDEVEPGARDADTQPAFEIEDAPLYESDEDDEFDDEDDDDA